MPIQCVKAVTSFELDFAPLAWKHLKPLTNPIFSTSKDTSRTHALINQFQSHFYYEFLNKKREGTMLLKSLLAFVTAHPLTDSDR